jgi:hypothetical protein
MLNEVATRITIAADILLTASIICHTDDGLTKEQREILHRVYDELEALRKEVEV